MLQTREIKRERETPTVIASLRTDAGCIRDANEDSGRHVNPNDTDIRVRKGTLTIVADGMGGHASGEVASNMAVELISELYYAGENLPPVEALRYAIERANEEIFAKSVSSEEYFGMGTTVITLVLLDDTAFCAHVGDSRLYRFRQGALEMLTLDHSHVMEMVKHGLITIEQARVHDDKNVILRALGTQAEVEVEVSEPFGFETGDTFLLCSDGLTDMLDDAEITEILTGETDIHNACERLINAAKENGGHDNITAGIVRIAAPDNTETGGNARITREITVNNQEINK